MCHLNEKEIKSNWLKIMNKINFQPQHVYTLSNYNFYNKGNTCF